MNHRDLLLMQNASFYEAFEKSDIVALDDIWSHGKQVKCVHPGWAVLTGWNAVKRSWQSIFASGMEMKFSLRNVDAEIYGNLGVVVLLEEVAYRSGATESSGQVISTNLFEFDGTSWKMIHHHGSPMIDAGDTEDEDETYKYN